MQHFDFMPLESLESDRRSDSLPLTVATYYRNQSAYALFQRREFRNLIGFPGRSTMNEFRPVEAADRLSQGVVVAAALAIYHRRDLSSLSLHQGDIHV